MGQNAGMVDERFQMLRTICLSLPESIEKLTYGEPGWFVGRGPQFVWYPNRHSEDIFEFWCAVPEGVQKVLIESDPAKFFVPPHGGRLMWLGIRPGPNPDWGEVEELILDAYMTVAPKRLRHQLSEELAGT